MQRISQSFLPFQCIRVSTLTSSCVGGVHFLRADFFNDHLYLCRIEKFDFLKLFQEKGFHLLVSKLYLQGCLDFYFLVEKALRTLP